MFKPLWRKSVYFWVDKCTSDVPEVQFCINYQKFCSAGNLPTVRGKRNSIAGQDECFESRGCAYKPFTISLQRKVNGSCNGNCINPGRDRVRSRLVWRVSHYFQNMLWSVRRLKVLSFSSHSISPPYYLSEDSSKQNSTFGWKMKLSPYMGPDYILQDGGTIQRVFQVSSNL